MADIKGYIKLQIEGGKANPAPPVGPALGQYGVPIQEFTQQFNEKTKDQMGVKLPTVITVYEDRTFTFIVKQPPAAYFVKDAAGAKKGSGVPHKEKVGHIDFDKLKEIADKKMPDLNAVDIAGAMKIMDGSARAAGITTDVHEMTTDEIRAKLG